MSSGSQMQDIQGGGGVGDDVQRALSMEIPRCPRIGYRLNGPFAKPLLAAFTHAGSHLAMIPP